MLDFSISELGLIGVVALIVIGPKRLPTVARTIGTLLGRAQRYARDVKEEVNQQMDVEAFKQAGNDLKQQFETSVGGFEQELSQLENQLQNTASDNPDWSVDPTFYDDNPTTRAQRAASKRFRKRRHQQTTRPPKWFLQQTGVRPHLLSGAARVARYRPPNWQRPT